MVSVPSPFGGTDDDCFDRYDEFVPANVPLPGEFLDGHDVLAGRRHLAFHRLTRDLFDERAVYDMTFGYNLARLNCDSRHPDAGYRYAEERESDDHAAGDAEARRVLRAEFWPTTPFCPQSDTLTKGSFRAWNGLSGRHEYDLVRVRVASMHQRSTAINGELQQLESQFLERGEIPEATGTGSGRSEAERDRTGGSGPTAPF